MQVPYVLASYVLAINIFREGHLIVYMPIDILSHVMK